MKKILLLSFFFSFYFSGYAQGGELWTKTKSNTIVAAEKVARKSTPTDFLVYHLDLDQMKSSLAAAPSRKNNSISNVLISFPTPGGTFETFRIYEASIMDPSLAARYPEIQSYVGVGVNNRSSIRFTTTLFGLHVMRFSADETTYIDTYTKDLKNYIVYSRDNLPQSEGFECSVSAENDATPDQNKNTNSTQSSTQIFRTYRLALSSTIEYSNFHINAAGLSAGTDAQKRAAVLAAMVVSMTRVNGLYERDMSLTMELVANNDILISLNAEDGFTNNNGVTLMSENQTFVTNNIGSANYDIGHIFSTGGGGVAALGSVCNTSQKARGVTGSSSPINDAFNIDYVAHEMGHQFGANHTFNSEQGSCGGGNRNATTAVEPASGTTIMAYAGICSPQNIQPHSDAHFSFISMTEMNTKVAGTGNCSVNVTNINAHPVIATLANYTIPIGTAFVLKGNATDAENDDLTYCWEQTDVGLDSSLPDENSDASPNFRSRPPSASPDRYMPVLSSVIANNLVPNYEKVPSIERTVHFTLTVRDNNVVNGGQTDRKNMTVTFVGEDPFTILTPNTNVSWPAFTSQTVTWFVAGTDVAPIGADTVDIYISTNSGTSFPTLLASQVPNTGSAVITVPNNVGTTNRLMVMGHNNIFFDVTNTNFTITTAPLGIEAPSQFNFSVYPNPSNGFFNVRSDKFTSEKIVMQVYDMRGRMIYNQTFSGSNDFNEKIVLENAQSGVYMLSVSDGKNKDIKRIVIE
ncbi:MAG: zinc-dependent metalloprotease family protein [Flavobacterium sp.]|nr:zinc-dependent metalloprotease family protein [Flavobacterium sp.]